MIVAGHPSPGWFIYLHYCRDTRCIFLNEILMFGWLFFSSARFRLCCISTIALIIFINFLDLLYKMVIFSVTIQKHLWYTINCREKTRRGLILLVPLVLLRMAILEIKIIEYAGILIVAFSDQFLSYLLSVVLVWNKAISLNS